MCDTHTSKYIVYITANISTSQGPVAYSVIATIEHIGSQITSGHYVAYIWKNDNWFCCSDDSIQKVDSQKPTRNPYLVILRKNL